MIENPLRRLLAFLQKLEKASIHYRVEHTHATSLCVLIVVPGERWEVQFDEDESIQVERFCSDGTIDDEAALEILFALFSDEP